MLSALLVVYLGWRLAAVSDWRKWRQQQHLEAYQRFLGTAETALVTAERVLKDLARRDAFDEVLAQLTLAETGVALLGSGPVRARARALFDHVAGQVAQVLDDPPASLEEGLQAPLRGRRLLGDVVAAARADLDRPRKRLRR